VGKLAEVTAFFVGTSLLLEASCIDMIPHNGPPALSNEGQGVPMVRLELTNMPDHAWGISRYCKDLIKHITKWYLSLNRWLLVCRIVPPVKAIVMMGSLPVEGSQILPVVLIPYVSASMNETIG